MERAILSVFAESFFEDLRPYDVLHLSAASQSWKILAKPYAVALAFALTRMRMSDTSLTLKSWQSIWQQCGEVAIANQLTPKVWAYSINMDWPESLLNHCALIALNPRIKKRHAAGSF